MDAAPRGSAKKNARKDAAGRAAARTRTTAGGSSTFPPRAAGDACAAAETVPGLCAALAELLPARGDDRAVLVAFDDGKDVQRAIETAKAAVETGARAVLVAASDEAAAAAAAARLPERARGVPGHALRPAPVRAGVMILALGADVRWATARRCTARTRW